MRFEVVDGGAALEASRVAAGLKKGDLPKVIREKQLSKKIVAHIEANGIACKSSFRPVGSGAF